MLNNFIVKQIIINRKSINLGVCISIYPLCYESFKLDNCMRSRESHDLSHDICMNAVHLIGH